MRAVRSLFIGVPIGALVLSSAPARADEPISGLDTVYMDVGAVYATNAVSFGDGMSLSGNGLRYYERHCCLARFLAAISFGLLSSAGAASNVKSQTSTSHIEGDYEVTETTTTYYSDEGLQAKRKAAADATASILTLPFTMELIYFPQRDDGNLHGFQWTLYLVDLPKRSPFRFETGLHWDQLGGEVNGMEITNKNFGMPFKLLYRPMGWVQLDAQFRWSFLGSFSGGEIPIDQNRNQMARGSIEVVSALDWPVLNLVDANLELHVLVMDVPPLSIQVLDASHGASLGVGHHGCVAGATEVRCWGVNENGQLGFGLISTTLQSSAGEVVFP